MNRVVASLLAIGIVFAAARHASAQDLSPARRIELLHEERERIRFDLPDALRVSGGILAGGAALVAMSVVLFGGFDRSWFSSSTEPRDDTALHAALVTAAISFGVGVCLTIAGVVIGSERRAQQRAIDLELEYLSRVAVR